MAGPEGPRKRTLSPGGRPKDPAKVRAVIRKSKKAAPKIEEIKEIASLPESFSAPAGIAVSAPVTTGGPVTGALPPKSKTKAPPAIKAALARAIATSEGKEPPPVSTAGVDPILVAEMAKKEAEEASAAAGSEPPTSGPGGALVFALPTGGRPSEFDPNYIAIAEELCAGGATDAVLADFFRVNIGTIYRWKAAHIEFRKAIFVAKQEHRDNQDNNVERGLYQCATGYVQRTEKIMAFQGQIMRVEIEEHVKPDIAAARLWLANRKPDQWRTDPDNGNNGTGQEPMAAANLLDVARRMGQVLIEAARTERTIDAEAVDVSPA